MTDCTCGEVAQTSVDHASNPSRSSDTVAPNIHCLTRVVSAENASGWKDPSFCELGYGGDRLLGFLDLVGGGKLSTLLTPSVGHLEHFLYELERSGLTGQRPPVLLRVVQPLAQFTEVDEALILLQRRFRATV
jgi:hypothetical protein